ncbi:SH3 domain-containing protein [Cesiribacter andamanensis]|uniref:SH3 domain-containing protein n=1 Tax=Cesiribacter andamanensis TaxID=649507 RepID=UPI001377DFFA|nr:SH3 domain-containing protein [Cesiribacter andamanensis]
MAAQQSGSLLQQADSLFGQQAYTEALPLYQQLLEQQQASPAMLLRMAYIQEGLGHVPEALYLLNLYYRETSDEAAGTRIKELAGQHKLQGYDLIEEEYLPSIIRRYQLPIILTLLILSLLLTGLLLYRRIRQQHRPVLTPLFLLVLLLALGYFVNFQPEYTRGILMQDHTYLMRGPSAGAGVLTQLKAGHRLEVLGREDVWLKVVWNDQIAWVKVHLIRTV